MSKANDRQVGGTHYRKHGQQYQHWDWADDTKQPYHVGCATKYVSRWENKNGLLDLEKSAHYLEKSIELGLVVPLTSKSKEHTRRFISSHRIGAVEARIIHLVMNNRFEEAITEINMMVYTVKKANEYVRG